MFDLLIENLQISTNKKLYSRFLDELSVVFDDNDNLKIISSASAEGLKIDVEIVDKVDSIFSLECVVFDLFIDVAGVFMTQATEMERYSNLLRLKFLCDFQGEGLVIGVIEVSGKIYEELSSRYSKEFGSLEEAVKQTVSL